MLVALESFFGYLITLQGLGTDIWWGKILPTELEKFPLQTWT